MTLRILLLLCGLTATVHAIDTREVLLRSGETADGVVRLSRDGAGNLVLQDASTTTTLGALALNPTDHGALAGLADDDHVQYHTAARHSTAHNATFNGGLPIPADVRGNTTLGAHTGDLDIHLSRYSDEAVAGSWTFHDEVGAASGAVLLGSGEYTADPALRFPRSGADAELSFNDTAGELRANVPLKAPELRVTSAISGAVSGVPTAALGGFATIEGIAAADLLSASAAEGVAGRWTFLAGADLRSTTDVARVRAGGLPAMVLVARNGSGSTIAAGSVVEFAGISGSEIAVATAPGATASTPFAGVAVAAASAAASLEIVHHGVATVTASGPIAAGDQLTWNGSAAVAGADAFGIALEPLTGSGTVRVWVGR